MTDNTQQTFVMNQIVRDSDGSIYQIADPTPYARYGGTSKDHVRGRMIMRSNGKIIARARALTALNIRYLTPVTNEMLKKHFDEEMDAAHNRYKHLSTVLANATI